MDIAIIGATGILGKQFLTHLEETGKTNLNIIPVASRRSVGKEVSFGDKVLKVVVLEDFIASGQNVDTIICATNAKVTEKWLNDYIKKSKQVIDLSSYLSKKNDEFLNGQEADLYNIEDAITLMVEAVLMPLQSLDEVDSVYITALEAASTHGKNAMDELYEQTKLSFIHQQSNVKQYRKRLSFNLVPVHGEVFTDGQTSKEDVVRAELKKVFGRDIPFSLHVVQVPTFVGTALTLTIKFKGEVTAHQVRKCLREAKTVVVMDDESVDAFATPIDTSGDNNVVVSRVREDWSNDTSIQMWVCADNLRIRCVDIASKIFG